MDAKQQARRQAILSRIESLPGGRTLCMGEDSRRRLEGIIHDFEAMVDEADETDTDRLEGARNWPYLGNAYRYLSGGEDLLRLEQTLEAYRRAEGLLQRIDNPREMAKSAYGYGIAIFGSSARSDPAQGSRFHEQANELAGQSA